ncbi:hypothetical protein FD755_017936, partial [Muntiacus reevesi]
KSLGSINAVLQLFMKSGMYVVGYKQTLKMFRQGKAKLVILASNCPALRKSEMDGDNVELGIACGKYYRACTLTVIDP